MKSCKAFDRRSSSVTPPARGRGRFRSRADPAGRQSSFGSHAPLPGSTYILYVKFVIAQVRKRQQAEDEFYATLDDDEAQ